MHEMQTIVVDDRGICQFVCHAGRLCNVVKQIDILFVVEIPGDPRYIVVDGGSYLPTVRGKVFDMALPIYFWPLVSA